MELYPLSNLFKEKPFSWGLRGDPSLWNEMREKIDSFEQPKTIEDFEKILYEMFYCLTGEEAGKNKQIYVERFSRGGMSSGFVDSDYWTEKAFKILKERFAEI